MEKPHISRLILYSALVGANFIYACVSIFTKMASLQVQFSLPYLLYFAGAVAVLGIYAVIWQQIIKRMDVSEAYMFKGLSLIFVMCIGAVVFDEKITLCNIIGAAMIVTGIVCFARS